MTDDFSPLAEAIYRQKYAMGGEDWPDTAKRVVDHVMRPYLPGLADEMTQAIVERKFLPGGRYLFATGKKLHQTQNCLLLSVDDSREGWSDLMRRITAGLMSGAGIGVVYSKLRPKGAYINGTGGESTGPLALMQMVNEAGRHIRQGGARRSAIWAGLHWNHPDIHEFIRLKDWSDEMKAAKEADFDAPATMDGTNISVILDDDFFDAYQDPNHPDHKLAHDVYDETVRHMLETGEPGFSVDIGPNAGEHLRNACVSAETELLTKEGYVPIGDLAGRPVEIWNGFEWSEVTPRVTGFDQEMVTVNLSDGRSLRTTRYHEFEVATDYVGGTKRIEAAYLSEGDKLIKHDLPVIEGTDEMEHAYTQGFISADGMDGYRHFWLYGEKVALQEHMHLRYVGKYDVERQRQPATPSFEPLPKSFVPNADWTVRTRLNWLAGYLDGDGCVLKEGGIQAVSVDRKFLGDVQKMLSTLGVQSKVKLFNKPFKRMMPDGHGGKKEYECKESWRLLVSAAAMKHLVELGLKTHRLKFSHSPNRDASRFVTVVSVEDSGNEDIVYCFNEPKRHLGLFDGVIAGQCTEVTSRDDNDICNLGSLNLARIESKEEMSRLVELSTAFLLCGSLYSLVPYEEVAKTREKNRRLGLGLMGVGEWLAVRGKPYGPDEELGEWLEEYEQSGTYANFYADMLGISRPVKTRAVAPAGTISIIGETTSGMEPMFAPAYKRRYAKGDTWVYQYVIDGAAERLAAKGIDPDSVDCAYKLAHDPARRLEMQAWLQQYVDHGISSTLNLPAITEQSFDDEEFGNILMRYLPHLRGITVYPDGARGGQPLTVVPYAEAKDWVGVEIEEVGNEEACIGGVCGV